MQRGLLLPHSTSASAPRPRCSNAAPSSKQLLHSAFRPAPPAANVVCSSAAAASLFPAPGPSATPPTPAAPGVLGRPGLWAALQRSLRHQARQAQQPGHAAGAAQQPHRRTWPGAAGQQHFGGTVAGQQHSQGWGRRTCVVASSSSSSSSSGGQQRPSDLSVQQDGQGSHPHESANGAAHTNGTNGSSSGGSSSLAWSAASSTSAGGNPGYEVDASGALNLKLPAGYLSSITSSPPTDSNSKGLSHRWKVVIMMAVAFVLCNMDKVNMSVAVIPMAHELGWSALDRGLVSSSFFWGYTLTQLPGGYIATQVGGARVLAAGVALWSFGTLIAPPAAQLGLLSLCASRVLVGLGEGVAPSAATTVLARLMPPNERSRAVSMVWGGLDVGSAVGLLLSGPLIRCYGWPSVFYLFALLGLVWCVAWPLVKPDKAPTAAAATAAGVVSPESAPSGGSSAGGKAGGNASLLDVPWGEFARSPPVWAVTVAHFCFNWGYYTLLAWLPSYFELALGLNVEKSSILTLIPYVAMTVMMPLVGPVADGMVDRGVPLTWVRKICQGISFVGPAACMVACALLTPQNVPASAAAAGSLAAAAGNTVAPGVPVVALVALMSLAFALSAWSRAGLYCNHQDLSPKYAGTLLGITNTAGALPGVLGVTAAGYLLDATNNWAIALFYPTAACQLFGAVIYSIFASSERQPWS